MVMFFNGIPSADVQISGGVTITPVNAVLISSTANGTTATMGTCPANKRWRIVNIAFSSFESGSTTDAYVLLNDVIALSGKGAEVWDGGYGFINRDITFNYQCSPVITAGQTIKFYSAGNGKAQVYYIEESV